MGGLIVTLSVADERLLHALLLRRRPLADQLMRTVTRVGCPGAIVPIAASLGFGVVPRLHEAGIVAAWSLAVSHLVVHMLKRRICRARPTLPVGLSWLIEPEDRFSFPSGHAAAGLSVALPVFVALAGPAALAVLALGLLVGVSRCYLGVHYPGDVVMGWTLAAATVLGLSLAFGM